MLHVPKHVYGKNMPCAWSGLGAVFLELSFRTPMPEDALPQAGSGRQVMIGSPTVEGFERCQTIC